ncbi:MAG TPA: hypothetical protein VFG02_08535 [Nitrospirota bacterium]|nr:hypothetical protein [Nitrospirota bacterium]
MDKVTILCDKDRSMMYEFSRRSLDRASGRSLSLVTLPFFSTYMDANVKKEVEKDRLIIEEAAEAYKAGKPACDLDLEEIFDKTKQVDKTFLDNLLIPSFSLSVRYSDFADIRIQRIWRISRTVYTLLANWRDTASFTDAARKAYTGDKFKEILAEILHLYNQETRMLSKSIRLFSPFNKAVSTYVENLFQAMEETTEDMADIYTKKIFGDEIVYAGN